MTDLSDQMRTCAAQLTTIEISMVLTDPQMEAIIHARSLLVEAADLIGAAGGPEPVGEPMEIIKALPPEAARVAPEKTVPHRPAVSDLSGAAWIDPGVPDLPTQPLSKNACPKCDSRANKTVHVKDKRFVLECPVCGHKWKR